MAADTAGSAQTGRMVKMHDVMCRALLEGNKRMAKADLYACWDHTGMDKKAFDALTAQALGMLDGQIKEEVGQLCSEHKLEEKFSALDSLIAAQGPAPAEEAPSAPLAAGGTPDPMEMLHSARQQVKREEKARLQGILAEVSRQTAAAAGRARGTVEPGAAAAQFPPRVLLLPAACRRRVPSWNRASRSVPPFPPPTADPPPHPPRRAAPAPAADAAMLLRLLLRVLLLLQIETENSEARTQVKLKSVRLQDAKQRLAEQQNNLDQATACLGTLGL